MALVHPLKWHGGKSYLANRIVDLFPRHLHYVEPYAGGLAVLLERDPNESRLWKQGHTGVSEVANDLHRELVNFWRVLQPRELFPEFVRVCQATPLSRDEFDRAGGERFTDPVGRAWAFFTRCRQSRAGSFRGFTSMTRSRTRRGINGNASEWLSAVDGLAAVHERLRPVVLENLPALELIRREDTPDTLFYLDPPYLHETRATTDSYQHEMTREQHAALLEVLAGLRGKFVLSGYESPLYNQYAISCGWNRRDFDIANHAAGGDSKRRMVECLWFNFRAKDVA